MYRAKIIAMSLMQTLNESPFEKEGKFVDALRRRLQHLSLNESPFEKEGKFIPCRHCLRCWMPSMKVPSKRKGNMFRRAVYMLFSIPQ